MSLFQQLAQVKYKLSEQLSKEDFDFLDTNIAKVNQARKDLDVMERYIYQLARPLETSVLKNATDRHFTEWESTLKGELEVFTRSTLLDCQRHINDSYKLTVKIPDVAFRKITDVETFLGMYFKAGDIVDLKAAGIEKIKKDFSDKIYYRNRYAVKGKSIIFQGLANFEWSYSSGAKVGYGSNGGFLRLVAAFNLFEFGETNSNELFSTLPKDYPDSVSFDKYELETEKIKSMQVYKNQNIKVTFSSPAQATAFEKMFGLDQKE